MSPFVAAGSQAWTQPYLRKRARRRCLPADTAMCDTLHSMVGRWAEPAPPPCLFPDAPLAVSLAQPVWIGVVLCWHPLPLVGKGGDRSLGGRRTRTPAQPGKPAGDARPTPAHPAKSGARALAAHSPVTAWVPGVASPSPAAHTWGSRHLSGANRALRSAAIQRQGRGAPSGWSDPDAVPTGRPKALRGEDEERGQSFRPALSV